MEIAKLGRSHGEHQAAALQRILLASIAACRDEFGKRRAQCVMAEPEEV